MSKQLTILLLLFLILSTSCSTREISGLDNINEHNKGEKDLSISNYEAYYHFTLSRLHLSRRNYKGALREARIAEQSNPESAALKYNLAVVLMSLNRFAEAHTLLEKSIELNPTFDPSHKLIGRIYATSNDPDKRKLAIDELTKSTQYDPSDSETYMFLGIIQSEQNDFDKAIKSFEKFVELSPRDERGYYFLGRLYYQKNQLEKAEDNLVRAVELNTNYISALIDLTLVYEKRSKLKEAENIYKSLIDRYPRNMNIYLRYGNFLFRANRKSEGF